MITTLNMVLSLFFCSFAVTPPPSMLTFEETLISNGLVDIKELDSTIKVDLKYARADNFMGTNVYGDFRKCYLQRSAARKLVVANQILKSKYPTLSLLVVDGLRPRHVQRKMWNIVHNTPMHPYVANPQYGSMHNFGCAVDITLIDNLGNRLDMGTPMDHFGALAQPRLEEDFLTKGKLSRKAFENRRILRNAMISAGFSTISIEWWHFEAFDKKYIRKNYPLIE